MSKLADNPVVPVTVTVTKDAAGNVIITCSPDPVGVKAVNTMLNFTLATAGYHFRSVRAIELDAPNSDFPYPSWTLSNTQATLYDLCSNDDLLKYTVHIVDATTGQEYSVDPEIKNGGVAS